MFTEVLGVSGRLASRVYRGVGREAGMIGIASLYIGLYYRCVHL